MVEHEAEEVEQSTEETNSSSCGDVRRRMPMIGNSTETSSVTFSHRHEANLAAIKQAMNIGITAGSVSASFSCCTRRLTGRDVLEGSEMVRSLWLSPLFSDGCSSGAPKRHQRQKRDVKTETENEVEAWPDGNAAYASVVSF